MRLFTLLFCLIISITACSPDEHKTPKVAESARQALDKAKMLDETIGQTTEASKQTIDEQSQ